MFFDAKGPFGPNESSDSDTDIIYFNKNTKVQQHNDDSDAEAQTDELLYASAATYNNDEHHPGFSSSSTTTSKTKKRVRYEGATVFAILICWGVYQQAKGFGGAASCILAFPVLLWLLEARTLAPSDAQAAISGYVWGVLVGPILAMTEMLGGIVLALTCFGSDETMRMLRTAAVIDTSPGAILNSFSDRLFREIRTKETSLEFTILYSLVLAGFAEEIFKVFVSLKSRAAAFTTNSRAHQLQRQRAYAVIVSGVGLGLAFAESALAVSNLAAPAATRFSAERVLSAYPIHIACGALSGARWHKYYVVESNFVIMAGLKSLVPSSILHGMYDLGLILLAQANAARVVTFAFGFCCSGFVCGVSALAIKHRW